MVGYHDDLRTLYEGQRKHDELAHRDVYNLPLLRRLTHLVLHLAKYARRLVSSESSSAMFRRTLVDAFIIALSAAEALRMDLPGDLLDGRPEPAPVGDRPLGRKSDGVQQWFLNELVVATGDAAKALESVDHLEEYPYAAVLRSSFSRFLEACLSASAAVDLDLSSEVPRRWQEFESSVPILNKGP